MGYGIQLYSVNKCMIENAADTIKKVAEMGYKSIEPCSFSGMTAKEYKALCESLGLTISGAHLGWQKLTDETIDETIAFLKEVGCPKFIIPNHNTANETDMAELVALINKYAPIFKANGLELMYHNHSPEFTFNQDKKFPHLILQKETDIRFEIDVYWTWRAGLNPLYVLEQLSDRIGAIHLKDGNRTAGTPVGQGEVPIKEVVEWAVKHNVDMVVENEPDGVHELEQAKECIDFLLK